MPFLAIEGGSAALEAEIIARIGRDIQPSRTDWTAEEAQHITDALHIGIEVAGCAVPDIGPLGPLASIAAFGNNMGLIIGPEIQEWPASGQEDFRCVTKICDAGEFAGTRVRTQ